MTDEAKKETAEQPPIREVYHTFTAHHPELYADVKCQLRGGQVLCEVMHTVNDNGERIYYLVARAVVTDTPQRLLCVESSDIGELIALHEEAGFVLDKVEEGLAKILSEWVEL